MDVENGNSEWRELKVKLLGDEVVFSLKRTADGNFEERVRLLGTQDELYISIHAKCPSQGEVKEQYERWRKDKTR